MIINNDNILLDIKNLTVCVKKKIILKNLTITIKKNETHAIIGPNGSGKSTLAKILTKHPDYTVKHGTITYDNKDLLTYTTEECAQNGIFLSFQNPVTIPGIKTIQFIKESLNSIRKKKNLPLLTTEKFLKLIKNNIKKLKMNENLLDRNVNENFSGGEKKYNEMLQILTLDPKLLILDEIDSGVDMDAIKIITSNLLKLQKKKTIILITHYEKLLKLLKPNYIHVLLNGKLVKTGNFSLLKDIEKKGYANLY